MFRTSIARYLVVSFTLLMAGLLTAAAIIAAQAWSRYALAGHIAHLAQADRKVFDALFAVRAQVPKVSTALIDVADPGATIQAAHAAAETEVESAMDALVRSGASSSSDAAAAVWAAWNHLERLQGAVRLEAAKTPEDRDLHHVDEWREAVHRTTDALSAASSLISNDVRMGDPLIAELVQVRRLAWTVRDHYGLQCSMLRPSVAAHTPLGARLLEAWAGDRAIYLAAWQSLDELLQRPGSSPALQQRVGSARVSTREAQAAIDDVVARLNDAGRSSIAGDRWTALCDGPFEAILGIARQAQAEATARADAMRSSAFRMLLWSGTGLLAAILLGAFTLSAVQRRLARPMRSLIDTIARLSQRELREPVPAAELPDEIGRMTEALEDLRKSALQAERLQAAMSRFTADASHQMRTPLSVLRAHIAVLDTLLPGNSDAHASLRDIQGAADRLQHLLIQLLNLARAESRQLPASDATDLRSVIQEVTAAHAPQALDAQLELHFEADSRPHPSLANPIVIKEIVGNLVDNAIRYNRPGGSVTVRLSGEASRYVLEVEDDGPGIPEAEYEKVFTRFYRMNRDQSLPGSGLGLAIVRSFAASLNARVDIGPGAAKKGLRVRLSFA